ncbi:hypothetical protein [Loigolactobacillus zhaoyuanensis]|uniref:hypothetical protein n=1 Tax=Loigolactobacillus zhaoyuanensis TaxID=2486017 RepID=UPI000F748315|nr:hypothetical protein [Loigolactobacillus zhaoyuanensis]
MAERMVEIINLWAKLFKHKVTTNPIIGIELTKQATYQPVAKYISVDQQQTKLIGLIASTLAAGSQTDSQFKVKKVRQINPEYCLMALLGSTFAAAEQPKSQFRINKIMKKIE